MTISLTDDIARVIEIASQQVKTASVEEAQISPVKKRDPRYAKLAEEMARVEVVTVDDVQRFLGRVR